MYDPDGVGLSIARFATGLTLAATCVVAIVAVLRAAYLAAAVVTAGAFVLQTVAPDIVWYLSTQPFTYYLSPSWQMPLVVVLLIPLIRRGPVVAPRALNLMLLVPVLSVALDAYGTITRDPSFQTGSRAVWQVLALLAIFWSVVDERVAMTFGLAFFSVVVDRATLELPVWVGGPIWPALDGDWSLWRATLVDMAVLAILPVLNIVVGASVAVRRAHI